MDIIKNKKGDAQDVATIVVLIFAIGIVFFISFFAFNAILDTFMTTTATNSSEIIQDNWQATKDLTNKFDYVLFGVFIALALGFMVSSYFVSGHPMFMIFYFAIVVIVVVVSSFLTKLWAIISTTAPLSTNLGSFILTNHLLSNLTIYTAIIGTVGLVIMFAKPNQNEIR